MVIIIVIIIIIIITIIIILVIIIIIIITMTVYMAPQPPDAEIAHIGRGSYPDSTDTQLTGVTMDTPSAGRTP